MLHNLQNLQKNLPKEVVLVAVSKTKSVELIKQAYVAGQRIFAENYTNEAIEKIQALKDLEIQWHFIGKMQSNKAKIVAQNFDWVQTIHSIEIAKKLNQHRVNLPKLNILIQINISNEDTKQGIVADELFTLANEIYSLENLTLRGIMAIIAPNLKIDAQKESFNKMRELFLQLQEKFTNIDTLSMGMSDDYHSAIECGSTMIRLGTAIFGKR